ncbi:MAG: ABC-2 family transporter protein [Vulcanimicrobiaceae bacterium]
MSLAMRKPRFRLEPYVAFAKRAMSREATYRFDVFTNIGSILVRVYLLRMVWVALYAHNAAPRDLPLHAIVTYSTVALLMGLVMDIDQTRTLHERLHDGSIITDFMKPIVVPLYYFADGTGEVLFHALLIVPSLALALLVVHVDVPTLGAGLAFVASFLIGYGIGFCINFLLNCTAFWTLEISAVQMIVTWLTGLLGGELVPLIFFPDAVQHVILLLPFAAMFSTPLLIYVGVIGPERWLGAIGLQLAWLAILGSLAVVVWRAGSKRIVVQGG